MARIFLLSCFLITIAESQIILQKEELVGSRYRLSYKYAGNEVRDSSADSEQMILIALPPHSKPKVTGTVSTTRIVKTAGLKLPTVGQVSYFREKGYLWIGNSYCLNIAVTPIVAGPSPNEAIEIDDFTIDCDFPASIQFSMPTRKVTVSSIIENQKYAVLWSSEDHQIQLTRNDSWIDYSKDYLKIGVAKDGPYRLTYKDLAAAGVPVGTVSPQSFKIYLRGKEIPIFVAGELDGIFNSSDYIEFLGRRNYGDVRYREVNPLGTSYYEYLNRYSNTTIYWLTWDGNQGKRVAMVSDIPAAAADTVDYYDELIHIENNVYWDFSLSGGEVRKNSPTLLENKTWNEGSMGVTTISRSFSVNELKESITAHAYVKIADYASSIASNAHDVAISINSNPARYDSGFINKYQVKVLKGEFLSSILRNGTNTVNLYSYPTQNSVNSIAYDWFELEYPRKLIASSDSLDFGYANITRPTPVAIAINGMTGSNVLLYKFSITDSSIAKITNFTLTAGRLLFIDTLSNNTRYFLRPEANQSAPIVFYKKRFKNLRSTTRQADYIAITHPFFRQIAESYVSFISSTYNISTSLVDITDIYDEFNDGFLAPEPIRDFLQAGNAYWQAPKPKYVFLIGKGTYDFYGNKHRYTGAPLTPDFIPSYGNPVSDTWFTIWDTTGALLPQMSIGRLPAKNLDEFQWYFTKHQKYVSKGYDDWNKRYIFFSGGDFTEPQQLIQAKSVNDAIINGYVTPLPIGGIVSDFYKTADPITNFGPYSPDYIKNAIDQGGVFISYIGHSGTQTWDNSITDIGQLENIRDRNPLITDFGCSTGKFAEPDVLSFSELATNDINGQAIAYIGNSSLGFTSTAYTFPQLFYKKLLIDTALSVGDTHRLAKLEYARQYGSSGVFGLFVLTNTLIGDPIVKLPIPAKPNLSLANATIVMTPSRPTEQTDTIVVEFAYHNFGKVTSDSIDIQISDNYQSQTAFSKTIRRRIPLFVDS
ncbi:MAG TPA: C25 family cysteine peptidase, partial [Nitrosomonas sp.]|nr:C25 family cysteine peptidase [Nitrosomonas sp.]